MHQTISIDCDGIAISATARGEFEVQLRSILELFRPFSSEFRDGFRLQIGWGQFILRSDSSNSYALLVPDYANDAANDVVDDLSLALWILVSQTAIVTASNIEEPSTLDFLDSVVVSKAALEADRLVLTRNPPREGDSGWYVDVFPQTGDAPGIDDLVKLKAFQLLTVNRYAVAAMLLPAGIGAVVNEEAVEVVFREENFEILTNNPFPQSRS